jgi:hypothetical protein
MRLCLVLMPLFLVALAAGCPKEMNAGDPVEWTKVEGAPESRDLFDDAHRKKADGYKQRAHVAKMRAAFVRPEETTCTVDDDCVLTPQHCCTCAAGGRAMAVHKDKLPSLLQRRGQACDDYTCAQIVSSDPSCDATRAACRDGKCVPNTPAGAKPVGAVGGTAPIPPEDSEDKGQP